MGPEFLTKLQTIIEIALLDATKALLPILLVLGIAYVRKLAQKLHTDAAVAAVEQTAPEGVSGANKYERVLDTLAAARVKSDPTFIEAAVANLKANAAPCPRR